MVDGFTYNKRAFAVTEDKKAEWEKKTAQKDLRKLTRNYALKILGTTQPKILETIRDRVGEWANMIRLPDDTTVIITRCKKRGGHAGITPRVLARALDTWSPIIIYLDQPRGDKQWCFYKFSPLAIQEEVDREGGTSIEDELLLFRLQLGVYVPEQEDQEHGIME